MDLSGGTVVINTELLVPGSTYEFMVEVVSIDGRTVNPAMHIYIDFALTKPSVIIRWESFSLVTPVCHRLFLLRKHACFRKTEFSWMENICDDTAFASSILLQGSLL